MIVAFNPADILLLTDTKIGKGRLTMRILLTNDDGVHAKGLWAMKAALDPLGDVDIVAPLTEQSGVSQQITYLNPLFC